MLSYINEYNSLIFNFNLNLIFIFTIFKNIQFYKKIKMIMQIIK